MPHFVSLILSIMSLLALPALAIVQLTPRFSDEAPKLLVGRELVGCWKHVVVFSPDGTKLAYLKQPTETTGYTYWVSDSEGTNQRQLYDSRIINDYRISGHLYSSNFSADNSQLAMIVNHGGATRARQWNAGGACDIQGKFRPATVETFLTGCAFAKNDLVTLESRGQQFGYQLMIHTAGQSRVVARGLGDGAVQLRISPDASKVAILVVQANQKCKIRTIEFDSGNAAETPSYNLDDVTSAESQPAVYWDAKSAGLFFQVRDECRTNKSVALMYFDINQRVATRMMENAAVVAVLDNDHIAVCSYQKEQPQFGILNFTTSAIAPMPEKVGILAGTGRRLVLSAPRGVFCAEYELAKPVVNEIQE